MHGEPSHSRTSQAVTARDRRCTQAAAEALPSLQAEHAKLLQLAEKAAKLRSRNAEMSDVVTQLPALKDAHRRMKGMVLEMNRLQDECREMQVGGWVWVWGRRSGGAVGWAWLSTGPLVAQWSVSWQGSWGLGCIRMHLTALHSHPPPHLTGSGRRASGGHVAAVTRQPLAPWLSTVAAAAAAHHLGARTVPC